MYLIDKLYAVIGAVLRFIRGRPRKAKTTPPDPAVEAPAPAPPPPLTEDTLAAIAKAAAQPAPPRPKSRKRRYEDKWAAPKGLELLKPQPRAKREAKPRAPKPTVSESPAPAPAADEEDEERYGQFSFRGALLDDLERYFFYINRMQVYDRDSYDLHRQTGIQIVPEAALQAFDKERDADQLALSPWFLETLPAFGAISYGISNEADNEHHARIVDDNDPRLTHDPDQVLLAHRLISISNAGDKKHKKDGAIWIPRFLYFCKFDTAPLDLEAVTDGSVVYKLTVYWDRIGQSAKWWRKRHKKGGAPQEYGVAIHPATGAVRVLRTCVKERVKVTHRDGYARRRRVKGGDVSIHATPVWILPSKILNWAEGRTDYGPEECLRRLFIEAAMLYESAALGSMIRVEVKKDKLAAVFGVDATRTSYFFKDRDVSVTANGVRKRIFHMVRPHARGEKTAVRLHFRGLRDFTWAGYDVAISVPGRDHIILPEFNVGSVDEESVPKGEGMLNQRQIGRKLAGWLKAGKGAVHSGRHMSG